MSAVPRYTFRKDERLTHKPTIEKLFKARKNRIIASPLSLVFLETELRSSSPCQLLISVPKKKFSRAVHRNRIKRLIREAYRLQKQDLYGTVPTEKQFALGIVYLRTDLSSFQEINTALSKLIHDFSKRIS